MLVERIYEYGKSVKALDEKARLIVFNCAEYAENPQLILAQLFGYDTIIRQKAQVIKHLNCAFIIAFPLNDSLLVYKQHPQRAGTALWGRFLSE